MTVFLKISVLQKCREKNATCTLDKTVLFSYVAQDIYILGYTIQRRILDIELGGENSARGLWVPMQQRVQDRAVVGGPKGEAPPPPPPVFS